MTVIDGTEAQERVENSAGAPKSSSRGNLASRLRFPSPYGWADCVVIVALSLIGALGFESSFGGNNYLLPAIGGVIVGAIAAVVAYLLRLSIISTVTLAIASFLLFGSAIAVPSQAILGVIPSVDSLASLVIGAVFGWADLITLKTPVGAPAYISVVPYVATWLVVVVSLSLDLRWISNRTRKAWKLAIVLSGPITLYVIGVLTGTKDPYLAGIRGVGFAVIALVWVGWRRTSSETLSKSAMSPAIRRKIIGTIALVMGAVTIGALVGALGAPIANNRFVLREEVKPPFDPLDYPSPLAGFRHYTKDAAETKLFTITGLSSGQRVRIATMDSYTGKLWNVAGPEVLADGSGAFNLVGKNLPDPAFAKVSSKETVIVTIDGYSDVWLPSIGYPTQITFGSHVPVADDNLRYNSSTGAMVLTSGLKKGMSYTITSDIQVEPTEAQLANVAAASIPLPPVNDVPDIVNAKADEFAGNSTTPIAKLNSIVTALKSTGYLSHGLASDKAKSQAGHGADRMNLLFTRIPMVGDQEQYASAFALMARHLGYPARVVMGFVQSDSNKTEFYGSDVTAWVEVAFEGIGWVAFDPTPVQTNAPDDQTTKPKTEPLPQVRQPPRTNQQQNDLLSPVSIDNKKKKSNSGFALPDWVYPVSGFVGTPLAMYFIPVLVIAALKRRRRNKRRTAGSGDQKAAGAWDELMDNYSELGYVLDRKSSRLQSAMKIQDQFAEQLDRRLAERRDLENAKQRRISSKLKHEQIDPADKLSEFGNTSSTFVRELLSWRPTISNANEELPGMPELYAMAEQVDRMVFSGVDVGNPEVEKIWELTNESSEDARRSVSWWSRQLSKFRIRSKRDWLEILSKSGRQRMPKGLKEATRA